MTLISKLVITRTGTQVLKYLEGSTVTKKVILGSNHPMYYDGVRGFTSILNKNSKGVVVHFAGGSSNNAQKYFSMLNKLKRHYAGK